MNNDALSILENRILDLIDEQVELYDNDEILSDEYYPRMEAFQKVLELITNLREENNAQSNTLL